jgi:hypothetical protein
MIYVDHGTREARKQGAASFGGRTLFSDILSIFVKYGKLIGLFG